MISLQPYIFRPSFHYRIWGGNKLKPFLNKDIPAEKIGESWEISTVPNYVSVLKNNPEINLNDLCEYYKERLLGEKIYKQFGTSFPLLIKFLDAEEPLSIQVHPDDEYAQKHHQSFGKTEMWYVLDAEKDAEIIIGFNQNMDEKTYLEKLNTDALEDIINRVPAQKGDVFFIPAGRMHAIGKGLLIAEIQQTSDITYRIYDYNRIDKDGNRRELHTNHAKKVLDYHYIDKPKTIYSEPDSTHIFTPIIQSPFFSTQKWRFEKNKQLSGFSWQFSKESFTVLIITEGQGKLYYNDMKEYISIEKGMTVLIPAEMGTIDIFSDSPFIEMLEIFI